MGSIDFLNERPWTAAALFALAAVIAALVVHRVLGGLLRRATRNAPVMHSILTAIQHPASAVWPLFALQLVWQALPDDMVRIGTVRHFNGVLLIGAITWLAIAAVRGLAEGIIARNPVTVADNLQARRIATQARILSRSAMVVIIIAGAAIALMTFPGARSVGASLLASAGVIGIVGGIAARPVFSNLIAGLQLALAQPIRIDDVLIVKGEYGRVEEITGTYVVMKLWDERRMVVPLQWFIENPFENWTRSASNLLHSVNLHLDFATPVEPLRVELKRILDESPEWDKRVGNVMVTDATERTMKVRILLSAPNSGAAFDLGCKVREAMIAFIAREFPHALPRARIEGNAQFQP